MAKPVFVVRLPTSFSIEQVIQVRDIMVQNLSEEYNVLVLKDLKRKGQEVKFECHNADYSDIEWEALEKRVNSIMK